MQSSITPEQGEINFNLSENQQMVIDMVRNFAEKHIRPHVMEWDEAQTFPVETFKKLGELGLMGVLVPEEYGGSGFGYLEYVHVISEILPNIKILIFF